MQAGDKLGPYEIVAPLGAGGMGEVFRARDGRLSREVALKVLPAAVGNDAVRLRRFETEARSAAQLNHPNILAVHDFGVAEGTPYLVTELLEGETLRTRLTPPVALPPRKAIDIAAQLARGLAAAHAKGIIHRDLKPENIFLTRDGQAKILDFGLAKSIAAASEEAVTLALGEITSAGQVLGTAGYMSPEQVRGQATDARSDLFALGAVLYEMLAGRRAFQRDTAAETMTAVLKEEPAAITPAGSGLEPGLQRVVDHCLEKDPAARFQSARDLEFALAALTGTSSTRLAAAADLPPARGRSRWPLAAAGIAGLILGGAAVFFLARPQPLPGWHFTAVTSYAGIQAQPALSPDGRSVAFASNQDGHFNIYVALLGGGSPVGITHGPNVKRHPAWSPDGATLAYTRFNQSELEDIWEIPALGGTPRRVVPDASEPSFTRQGDLVYSHGGAIWEAGAAGENPHQIVAVQAGFGADLDARLSPDGKLAAFTAASPIGGPYQDLAVANLADGKVRFLTHAGLAESPAWAPDSRSLYFAYNRAGALNIWKINVDGSGLRQITAGEGDDTDVDVSADGKRIMFGTAHGSLGLGAINLQAPAGKQDIQVLSVDPARSLWGPAFSPDGKRLAYFTSLKGVLSEGIGIANADGSSAVPLVEDGREDIFPHWSADGQSVLFETVHPRELRLVPVAGGSPRTLGKLPAAASDEVSAGRDGRVLFLSAGSLETMDPATGKTQVLGKVPAGAVGPHWSPDERQAAYVIWPRRGNDPDAGVWLTNFHAPPRQIFHGSRVTLAATPTWLYVLQEKPDFSTVLWRIGWNGTDPTQLSTLIPLTWQIGSYINFVVSPDGQTAIFQVASNASENLGLLTLTPAH